MLTPLPVLFSAPGIILPDDLISFFSYNFSADVSQKLQNVAIVVVQYIIAGKELLGVYVPHSASQIQSAAHTSSIILLFSFFYYFQVAVGSLVLPSFWDRWQE